MSGFGWNLSQQRTARFSSKKSKRMNQKLAARGPAVFVVVVLLAFLSAWLLNTRRGHTNETTLAIQWNLTEEHPNGLSVIATASLDPPVFDLETIKTITLSWRGDFASFEKISSSQSTRKGKLQSTWWEGTASPADSTQLATLVCDAGGAITGSFSTTRDSFSVTTLSNGSVQVRKTPWELFPSSADADEWDVAYSPPKKPLNFTARIVRKDPDSIELKYSSRRPNSNVRKLQDEDDVNVVDLLVLVTSRATCEFDGERAGCDITEDTVEPMDRRLSLSVAQTNAAFSYGGVEARLRLVEVIYLEGDYDGRPNTDTVRTMLFEDDIQDFRDEVGADLVMMVTGIHPRNCGIALLDRHVSVVGYDCFDSYTFTHEIGHNFGANHDRDSTPDFQHHPYGHGFEYDDEFHTIMSYGCPDRPCPMAPYFSAEDQELPDGRPLGDDEHDNVRVMNDNAADLADLRDTVVDDEEDDDEEDDDERDDDEEGDDEDEEEDPPTLSPTKTIDRGIDQVLDCPESDRCGTDKSSYSKGSGESCEELCVCRENCKAADLALWISYAFAGYSCGECDN